MSTSDEDRRAILRERAARLRSARVSAGFESQRDAAKAVGVSEGTYNPWENGNRPFKAQADRLAEVFGVSRAWLLYGEQDPDVEAMFAALRDVPADVRSTAAAAARGVIERFKQG